MEFYADIVFPLKPHGYVILLLLLYIHADPPAIDPLPIVVCVYVHVALFVCLLLTL